MNGGQGVEEVVICIDFLSYKKEEKKLTIELKNFEINCFWISYRISGHTMKPFGEICTELVSSKQSYHLPKRAPYYRHIHTHCERTPLHFALILIIR